MVESEMIPQRSRPGPSISFLRNPSGVLLVVNFVSIIINFIDLQKLSL